jgi:hypothetical protein
MKRAKLMFLLGVMAPVSWSCSSDTAAGPGFASEAGSNSLLVVAEIKGEEDIGSSQFSTGFLVKIRDSVGQAVNNAQVTLVHSQWGTIALA